MPEAITPLTLAAPGTAATTGAPPSVQPPGTPPPDFAALLGTAVGAPATSLPANETPTRAGAAVATENDVPAGQRADAAAVAAILAEVVTGLAPDAAEPAPPPPPPPPVTAGLPLVDRLRPIRQDRAASGRNLPPARQSRPDAVPPPRPSDTPVRIEAAIDEPLGALPAAPDGVQPDAPAQPTPAAPNETPGHNETVAPRMTTPGDGLPPATSEVDRKAMLSGPEPALKSSAAVGPRRAHPAGTGPAPAPKTLGSAATARKPVATAAPMPEAALPAPVAPFGDDASVMPADPVRKATKQLHEIDPAAPVIRPVETARSATAAGNPPSVVVETAPAPDRTALVETSAPSPGVAAAAPPTTLPASEQTALARTSDPLAAVAAAAHPRVPSAFEQLPLSARAFEPATGPASAPLAGLANVTARAAGQALTPTEASPASPAASTATATVSAAPSPLPATVPGSTPVPSAPAPSIAAPAIDPRVRIETTGRRLAAAPAAERRPALPSLTGAGTDAARNEPTDRLLRSRPNTAFPAEALPAPAPLAADAVQPAMARSDAAAPALPAIDTHHREWRAQMVERIEHFVAADPAPGRETRITLSPDALGDVALRLKETDRGIEVVVDAAPEARALLAEAAPRLTEMAESRGLRLTLQQPGQQQTAGDGGARQPPRQTPDAPIPNRRAATAASDTPTDERIA